MEFIPVNEPLFDGNEKKYLMECIDSGWISSEGPFVRRFEKEMAAKVDRLYGVAVANGTVALELAVEVLNIEKGMEVIMPSFTIVSCAIAVIRAGLIPVFVDSDMDTWNMDTQQIEDKITNKTRAIMVVHIYGLPVDVDPIIALAQKYNLKMIEDAAEMHGQTYKDKPCGSFGDISIFSFYPNKHITTGEGGMILTNNNKLAERCQDLRNLFHSKEKRFVHHELGYNYRMTNLQAAVGLAQLEKLDEHIIIKRKMGKLYTELLANRNDLQLPIEETIYAKNIYWVYGILLKGSINAETVMQRLKEKGIDTRSFFCPMHKQPVFLKMDKYNKASLNNAELLYEKGFYLPSGMALTEEAIMNVSDTLIKVLG